MERIINVDNSDDIISVLRDYGIAKNKIKTYVKLGFIYVNNKQIDKLPYNVSARDVIKICTDNNIVDIDIIYEDSNYLIVNKDSGLLTISTDKVNRDIEDTLYKRVRYYLNKKHELAFIVNRLDRDTSGIVVFVKNDKLKNSLQDKWNDIVKKRGYVAVVSGNIRNSGRIDNYIYEDKMTFSHSTKIGGKRAITLYKPIKNNGKYTMLDVNILTGRKNQIRVHFSEMGHPILGDKKYGSHDNRMDRLMLHNYELSFICPISNKLMEFKVDVPKIFYNLFD